MPTAEEPAGEPAAWTVLAVELVARTSPAGEAAWGPPAQGLAGAAVKTLPAGELAGAVAWLRPPVGPTAQPGHWRDPGLSSEHC